MKTDFKNRVYHNNLKMSYYMIGKKATRENWDFSEIYTLRWTLIATNEQELLDAFDLGMVDAYEEIEDFSDWIPY